MDNSFDTTLSAKSVIQKLSIKEDSSLSQSQEISHLQLANQSLCDYQNQFLEKVQKLQRISKSQKNFSSSFSSQSHSFSLNFGKQFYNNILQVCAQMQKMDQNIQKDLKQSLKEDSKQNLQQLKQLISSYQKLTEENSKETQIRKNIVRPLKVGQTEEAVRILQNIIQRRQKHDLTISEKLIQDKIIEWKCEGEDKFQNPEIYNNYKAAINQFNLQQIYKSEADFMITYKKYVIQRHLYILETIKQLNDLILLRFYDITKQEGLKGITIRMQKGLVLPLTIQIRRGIIQLDFFRFFSFFSSKIKLKFVKQITESLKLLNSKGIWHNDIRILNIVYSVQDNKFKLIDYDSARLKKFKSKQVNYSYGQIVNFDYFLVQRQHLKQKNLEKSEIRIEMSYNKFLNKKNEVFDISQNSMQLKQIFQSMYDKSILKTKYYAKNDKIMLAKLFECLFQNVKIDNNFKYYIQNNLPCQLLYENKLFHKIRKTIQIFIQTYIDSQLKNEQMTPPNNKSQILEQIKLQLKEEEFINKNQNNMNSTILDVLTREKDQAQFDYKSIEKQIWRKADYVYEKDDLKEKLSFDQIAFGLNSKQYQETLVQLQKNYYKYGEYEKALSFYLKNQNNFKQQGKQNSLQYAAFLNELGLIYKQKVDYPNALKCYYKSTQIKKYILGQYHPDFASSLTNIGQIFIIQGDYDKGLGYFLSCLKIQLGQNNPDYAGSLQNIGWIYEKKGEYKKALQYYFKSSKIQKIYLGQNNSHYAGLLGNIGTAYYKEGDYDKTLEYYTKSLQIRKNIQGENHPYYATSLSNIGLAYDKKGDYDKAFQYYFKSMEIRKKCLGQNHPDYATSLNNIGGIYSYKGNFDKSLQNYIKALKIRKVVLGENHPDYAISLANIGTEYFKIKDYEKSLQYYTKSLQIQKFVLGQNHPDYAYSLNSVGTAYHKKKEYDKAQAYYFKAFQIRKVVLGKNHPDFAYSLKSIGSLFYVKGEVSKSIEYYFKALQIQKLVLGQNHSEYASSLINIGFLYSNKGDYQKSLLFYLKAQKIRKVELGQNDPKYTDLLIDIGLTYNKKNNYNKALQYYFKSLEIYKVILCQNHPDYAVSLNNIGAAYQCKGDYGKALEYYLKSLEIRKIVLGQNHPEYANLLNNIGTVYDKRIGYNKKEDYDIALKYILKSLEIQKIALGQNHPNYTNSLNSIGLIYHKKRDYNKSFKYYLNSFQIRIKNIILTQLHPQQIKFLNKTKQNNKELIIFQNQKQKNQRQIIRNILEKIERPKQINFKSVNSHVYLFKLKNMLKYKLKRYKQFDSVMLSIDYIYSQMLSFRNKQIEKHLNLNFNKFQNLFFLKGLKKYKMLCLSNSKSQMNLKLIDTSLSLS